MKRSWSRRTGLVVCLTALLGALPAAARVVDVRGSGVPLKDLPSGLQRFVRNVVRLMPLAREQVRTLDALPLGQKHGAHNSVAWSPLLAIRNAFSWARADVAAKDTGASNELPGAKRTNYYGGGKNGLVSLLGWTQTGDVGAGRRPAVTFESADMVRPGYVRSVGTYTIPNDFSTAPDGRRYIAQHKGRLEAVPLTDEAARALGVPAGEWLAKHTVFVSRSMADGSGRFEPAYKRVSYYVPGVADPTCSVHVIEAPEQLALVDRVFKDQVRAALTAR
ncbi:MAG: hypothetical protein IT371_11325 [Deltaproteobacteria bacterium]|nr:hypothetical protein [Deltaproteobacteria bacterium]